MSSAAPLVTLRRGGAPSRCAAWRVCQRPAAPAPAAGPAHGARRLPAGQAERAGHHFRGRGGRHRNRALRRADGGRQVRCGDRGVPALTHGARRQRLWPGKAAGACCRMAYDAAQPGWGFPAGQWRPLHMEPCRQVQAHVVRAPGRHSASIPQPSAGHVLPSGLHTRLAPASRPRCREVQRILMELLTQMDGFEQSTNVKVGWRGSGGCTCRRMDAGVSKCSYELHMPTRVDAAPAMADPPNGRNLVPADALA